MKALNKAQGLLSKDPAEAAPAVMMTQLSNRNVEGYGSAYLCAHTGSSMNPTFCDLDLLEVTTYDGGLARIGDVILFRQKTKYIVHRITKVTPVGICTRGDNSSSFDPWILDAEMITGRVTAAWRGNRRRVIHGGLRGRMQAMTLYFRLKIVGVLTAPMKLVYHALAQSGITQPFFQMWCRRSIATYKSSKRYPMHLRFGQYTIGRFDMFTGTWIIRCPFRLLVDESRLPKSVAAKHW